MRKIALIVLALLLALCLFGCSAEKEDNLDEFEELLLSTGATDESSEPFASIVYVVMPENCSAELATRAREFARTISDKTGVAAVAKYDNEPLNADDKAMTVLLGNTSKAASKDNMRALRANDSIFRYDRGYFILGGKSDQATIAAINKFQEEMLAGASYAYFVSEDAHFELFGDYALKSLSLNGFDIYDFSLIYTNDTERELATALCNYIVEKSGYLLDCIAQKDYATQNGILLKIDQNLSRSEALIEADRRRITLRAADAYGLSAAVASFADRLFENITDGVANAVIPSETVIEYEIPTLDVSVIAADNNDKTSLDFVLDFVTEVKRQSSEVIFFTPLSIELAQDVELNLPTDYKLIYIPFDEGRALIALYKEQSFSSADCTLKGDFACLKLKRTDGQEWKVVFAENKITDEALLADKNIVVASKDLINCDSLVDMGTLEYGFANSKASYNIYRSGENIVSSSFETVENQSESGFVNICRLEIAYEYCREFIELEKTVK